MFGILLNTKKIRSKLIHILVIFLIGCSSAVEMDTLNKTTEPIQTRAEWSELLKWPKSCDDGVSHITKNSEGFVGVDVYSWSLDRKLVSVTCETGTYNQGEMLFLETGKETGLFNLLIFPQFKAISDAPQDLNLTNKEQAHYFLFNHSLLWGNLNVDNNSGTIRNDDFYRGGGGCGVSSTYYLLNNVPEISALHIQETCEEKNIPISEWKARSHSEYSKWPMVK